MSESDVKESIQDGFAWKLRFFTSIDLIGSTAYKASFSNDDSACSFDWSTDFKEFLEGFKTLVRSQDGHSTSGAPLEAWKFLGDEVLLVAELTSCEDVVHLLRALRSALNAQNKAFKEKGVPLRCKACSWVAGFPLGNTEIQVDGVRDYLGPQIDLGFRLAKFASERQHILSLDCAYMLCKALLQFRVQESSYGKEVKLHFLGRETLRGVNGDRPYPIFWMDQRDDSTHEDCWLGLVDCTPSDLMAYADDLYQNEGKQYRKPFIEEDKSQLLCEIPAGLVEIRNQKITAMRSKEEQGGEIENPSGSSCDDLDQIAEQFLRATDLNQ